MEPLECQWAYPEDVRKKLEQMSPLAREIANRWMRGWPRRVKALVAAGEYLRALEAQEEADCRAHAGRSPSAQPQGEGVQGYGLSSAPPYPVGSD